MPITSTGTCGCIRSGESIGLLGTITWQAADVHHAGFDVFPYTSTQPLGRTADAHASNHNALLPPSASAWVRRTLAESIRSRNPYAVNLLLGGYDTTTDLPHLYWLDYLGTKATLQYGAHGAGMYVALSLMDKWWYEGMDKKAGVDLLNRCIDEVQNRESYVVIVVEAPRPTYGEYRHRALQREAPERSFGPQ